LPTDTSKATAIKNVLNIVVNPRYLLRVDGWTCKTSVDSSYGYSVTNFDGKQVQATIGTHYGTATLNSLKGLDNA